MFDRYNPGPGFQQPSLRHTGRFDRFRVYDGAPMRKSVPAGIPYGYARNPYWRNGSTIIIDEQQARAIRLVFELHRRGSTLQAISDELDKNGYRTRRGMAFRPQIVRVILAHESAYRGGSSTLTGEPWPAILE
jgi:hypothetical protein